MLGVLGATSNSHLCLAQEQRAAGRKEESRAGWGLPSPAVTHDFSLQGSSRRARPQGPIRREGGTGKRWQGMEIDGELWGDRVWAPGMAARWKMGGGRYLLKLCPSALSPSGWGYSHSLRTQEVELHVPSSCTGQTPLSSGFHQHPWGFSASLRQQQSTCPFPPLPGPAPTPALGFLLWLSTQGPDQAG